MSRIQDTIIYLENENETPNSKILNIISNRKSKPKIKPIETIEKKSNLVNDIKQTGNIKKIKKPLNDVIWL